MIRLLITGVAFITVAEAAEAQCARDREISTVVGAGLGGAIAAIPATIVHRHDQASSHRIVAVSVSAGALIGFVSAGRDRPCVAPADTSRHGDVVLSVRSRHARRGALTGALVGSVAGAIGGTFYSIGCTTDPCHETRTRMGLMLFSAGEGAIAGGLLGGLIGWVLPARH